MSDSQLPSGWSRKPLGDVARIEGGGTPSRAIDCYWVDGTIPWATPTDITACSNRNLFSTKEKITARGFAASAAKLLPKYTVLMTSRATVGESKVAQVECCTNQGFKNLIANRDTDSWFLYYQMQRLKEDYRNFGIGSTFLEVSKKDTDRFLIDIPSYAEQQSIADILTTLDNLIDHTESLIAKYQAIKQGMMHDLFTRGVDANGRLRQSSISKHPFPHGWETMPLRDIASISSGITLGKTISGVDTVKLPYLRVANVQDGYLDLHEIKSIRIFRSDVSKYSLLPGDLLLTEGGDFDKLGRGTLWNGEIQNCLHQNHIFRIRPNQSIITPQFLESIVSSSYGKRYFLNCSKQTTNLASINSSQLGDFPVPCPSLDEQQRITNPLISLTRKLEHENIAVAKLAALKSGLMHDLLTGTVRIPPHLTPAQEPPHAV